MKLLAFDPGVTTGFAVLEISDSFNFVTFGSFAGWKGMEPLIVSQSPDVLVCEDFIVTMGATHFHRDSLYAIGVCQYLSDKYRLPLIMQGPSLRKATMDHQYKEVFRNAKDPYHKWDALGHALTYASKKYGRLPFVGEIEW